MDNDHRKEHEKEHARFDVIGATLKEMINKVINEVKVKDALVQCSLTSGDGKCADCVMVTGCNFLPIIC